MQYDNLPVDEKLEIIDRMSIKDLLIFSKTSRENNILVKRRIRIIRNDLANNGLTQQEMNDILDNEHNFFDFVNNNRINEVRVILKYFPEYINIKDFMDQTALMIATGEGSIELVRILLENGANVNIQDNDDGHTALMTASRRGYINIARMLIDAGADLEIKDESGDTALMYATTNSHTETVRMLLDVGADVNTIDEINQTVLFNVSSKFPDLYQLLIDRGINVNVQESDEGQTVLMSKIEFYQQGNNNQLQIIIMLLNAGADLNLRDRNGKTALMYANEKGNQEIIDLLLQHGATQ